MEGHEAFAGGILMSQIVPRNHRIPEIREYCYLRGPQYSGVAVVGVADLQRLRAGCAACPL